MLEDRSSVNSSSGTPSESENTNRTAIGVHTGFLTDEDVVAITQALYSRGLLEGKLKHWINEKVFV